MSTDRIDLDMVLKRIMAHVGNDFPNEKLKNRLLNLGLEEFVGVNGVSQSSSVLKYGFPFKFNNQLDEGILVLAHFLDRFKKEGGSLEIYAINKLSKGQEKDLSFWHDAKARLYLELQNIILLLHKTEFTTSKTKRGDQPLLRRSRIRRIFTFGELTDLAFLSQAGINVLGEQLAANIDVGFLFLKTFAGTSKIKPLNNTLIINYRPQKATPLRHNFYELYGFHADTVRYDLPYKDRCSARWFTRKEQKFALKHEGRLNESVSLFTDDVDKFSEESKEWEDVNSRAVCRFEQNSAEFFNDAMLMMFKAYRSEIGKDINNGKFIIDRINGAVITRDMIRLQRAMSSFGNAIEIKAVDATSTKNSLNVHESSPVYRDWLRRSLNRVLRSTDKTLHRIYILDDDEKDQDKDIEYQTLLRLMQFYRDYFHYEVSDVTEIVERHNAPSQSLETRKGHYRKWFETRWKTFENRVEVHVTSSTVIRAFAEGVLRASEYPAGFELLFRSHVEEGKKKEKQITYYTDLAKLDYLYAKYERMQPQASKSSTDREERMIYNFLNPRADTGELRFPAFTYRDTFSTQDEKTRVFGFEHKGLGVLDEVQVQHRVNLLAVSLLQYADTYVDVLGAILKGSYAPLLATIRKERAQEPRNVTISVDEILDARRAFEKRLYDYFRPHFDYLYAVLEFMSVKIDFWENINASSVREISPFRKCETEHGSGQDRVKPFTTFLMAQVQSRLDDHPEQIPQPEKFGLTSRTDSSSVPAEISPTEPRSVVTLPYDVFISYKLVSPINEWVHGSLNKCLLAAGLRVSLDDEVGGFNVGERVTSEMERAVKQSSHTLAIITPGYFDGHSGEEAEIAHRLGLKGKKMSFIPMVLHETTMPEWVGSLFRIKWTDPQTFEKQWQKLLKALDAPNKEASHPGPVS